MKLWESIMTVARRFRKKYFDVDDPNWEDLTARVSRYAIYQSFYDNDAYDDVHTWVANMKVQYALYTSIRSVSSPGFTIGEFYKNHIWGGVLNPDAENEGAIPISARKTLRNHISDIWEWSRWSKNRNLFVLKGTVCGDVGLRIVDDISRNKVYLEIIDPSLVKEVDLDPFGNVKAYTLEYDIEDGRTYKEEVTRDGQYVVYRTYKDDSPFAYEDNVDRTGTARQEWREPYGFIPFVWVNHIPTGNIYGNSELFAGLSKFRELDNQVSLLSDQIANTIEPIWWLTGATAETISFPKPEATDDRVEPWKDRLKLISVENDKASFDPKIAQLNIAQVTEYLKQLDDFLIKDYPELQLHRLRTEGNLVSGRALRIAQMPAEARVIERRTIYDAALKAALQMAMSIGGMREIFRGISMGSYEKGDLDFEIEDRPVFKIDPQDQSEMDKSFWEAAEKVKSVGGDPKGWLKNQGWSDEEIDEVFPEEEENTATEPVIIQEMINDRQDVFTGRPGQNNFGEVGETEESI